MAKAVFDWTCNEADCEFHVKALQASDGFRSSDRYGRGIAALHGRELHDNKAGSWQYWARKLAHMPVEAVMDGKTRVVEVTSPTGRVNRYETGQTSALLAFTIAGLATIGTAVYVAVSSLGAITF